MILIPVLLVATFALSQCSVPTSGAPWAVPTLTSPFGMDEFGRNIASVLVISAARSMLFGTVLAALSIGMALLVAFTVALKSSKIVSLLLNALTAVVESIPTVLWILVAFSAFQTSSKIVTASAFILATLPFISTILRSEFERLSNTPYVEASRLLGLSDYRIMLRHIIPNSAALTGPLFVQVAGMAAAVEGAIGILGFTNRTDLDLGMVLLRGKENLSDHPVVLSTAVIFVISIYCALDIIQTRMKQRQLTMPKGAA
jgi:ABC-type dipeptide/oligopeptide/nickel transport system permease subunit